MLKRICFLMALVAVVTAKRKGKRRSKFYKQTLPDPSQYLVEGQEEVSPTGVLEQIGVFTLSSDKSAVSQDFSPQDLTVRQQIDTATQYCPENTILGEVRLSWDYYNSICFVSYSYFDSSTNSGVVKVTNQQGTWSDSDQSCHWGVTSSGDSAYHFYRRRSTRNPSNSADDATPIQDLTGVVETTTVIVSGGDGVCQQEFDITYENSESRDGGFSTNQGVEEIRMTAVPVSGLSTRLEITQSTQGGYKIAGSVTLSGGASSDEANNKFSESAQVTIYDFSSYGSFCAVDIYDTATRLENTGVDENDYIPTAPKKVNKRQNRNWSKRKDCPSFYAGAMELGGEPAASDGTFKSNFWGFSGRARYYDNRGRLQHKRFSLMVQLFDYNYENYLVTFVDEATQLRYVAVYHRTALSSTDLALGKMKQYEINGKDSFKRGHDAGSASAADVNSNGAKSMQPNFKADKVRSWKKGSKNKHTNRRRRRRQRKASGSA